MITTKACGCGPVVNANTPLEKRAISEQERTARAARAMCCWICPERLGAVCGVTGASTYTQVTLGRCPVGGYPDAAGVVVAGGVRFHGVPAPVRWLWGIGIVRWIVRGKVGEKPRKLPGCGCAVAPKALWTRLKAGRSVAP